jgi:16S rRNA (cytosine967-C5)-methyltransferase
VAESQPARVLDLCAAPGGKTTHLAQLLPRAQITAADASTRRLELLEESLRRVGLADRVRLREVDGRNTGWEEGRFDAVLVDAPCTGTGVLARRQDARYRRDPGDLQTMAALQIALLEEALRLVRPGGEVVYSTCSLEHEENDAVVDTVLEKNSAVEEIGVGTTVSPELQRGGRMQVWPQRSGCDGAFAARLRRLTEGEPA